MAFNRRTFALVYAIPVLRFFDCRGGSNLQPFRQGYGHCAPRCSERDRVGQECGEAKNVYRPDKCRGSLHRSQFAGGGLRSLGESRRFES
jgi:hypothetical protein